MKVRRHGLGMVILAASPLFGGCGGGEPLDRHAQDLVELAEVEDAPPLEREATEVKRGEPLDLTLRRLRLSGKERAAVLEALGSELDFRRILPGETAELGRDRGEALREFVLHRDARRRVLVAFPAGGGTPRVETIAIDPEIRIRAIEGAIHGSLYEAILDGGGDPSLVMRFADLLAWQVDFLTEPRRGDRFRILVEEERLGEEIAFGRILAAEYRGQRAWARAVRYVERSEERDWFDDSGESVRRAFLKSPLNYRRISSGFSARRRHPILKTVRPHWGVDYAAPTGTPVSALGSGIVTFVGRKGGFGNYVEVRHNSSFTTCYGHLSRFSKGLRRGERVEQGEVIGYVGSTGLSTGPHLDFRVKRHGQFVDPLRLESPPGRRVPPGELARFQRHRDRLLRLMERIGPEEALEPPVAWSRVPMVPAKPQLLALAP